MDTLALLERDLLEQRQPLQWERLSAWVHGICVVTFDLELGQAIESVYPGGVQLSETDKANVCYLAFPDSNSGVMGDSQFHFRVRLHQPKRVGHLASTRVHTEYNRRCPAALQFDPNYLFGFAYFRQVKDSSVRRGYFQKSVILLSKLPLVTLFSRTISVVARRFFDGGGEAALETACADLDRWTLPTPGHGLELPLMGCVLQVHLPSHSTRSVESGGETVTFAASSSGGGELTPSVCEVDLFTCLLPVVEHVHVLWELVLTAEPLVVMAATPTLCSATVQYLTSIIYPLSYCADYRPFYTIHDSDFKEITGSNSNALPNILLGVTNPFFAKALDGWPHIVRLGDQSHHEVPRTPGKRAKAKVGAAAAASSSSKASLRQLDSRPGVFSQTKPLLDRDKAIVKRVLKGVQLKRPAEVQSALLRRHFLELTQTFMIPLERYLASLMPLAKSISPYRAVPKVRPFNADDFLASLDTCGPQLTSTLKGDWRGLYQRFFRGPNFVGWYNQRHREVTQKLMLLHLEALAEARIEHWMRDKEEVQLVDMVLRIRNKLDESSDLPLADVSRERLTSHVDTLLAGLPEDLRGVMLAKKPLGSGGQVEDESEESKE